MLTLVLCFWFASMGVYVFIPKEGFAGLVSSMLTVAAFLSLVYLVKFIILL